MDTTKVPRARVIKCNVRRVDNFGERYGRGGDTVRVFNGIERLVTAVVVRLFRSAREFGTVDFRGKIYRAFEKRLKRAVGRLYRQILWTPVPNR